MVTNWLPQLERAGLPLFREIADLLARDIDAGTLAPGTRLPTHRDLAWRLDVTVGTVSRAYAEAERRGLIGGEIGRGTFVLPRRREWFRSETKAPDGFVDLSVNYPVVGSEAGLLADSLAELSRRPDLAELLRYQPHVGRAVDRAAGAELLRRTGFADADPERTIVTNGGQHGISLLLTALTRPGDVIAAEHLTYPGLKAIAQQLGLQIIGLAVDDDGLRPDALDAACRARPVRLLYTLPTLHNPTTLTMSVARRREIAALVRHHDIAVVEDDVYGFLLDPAVPALAGLVPERGFYISSTSKIFAPGLRIGYVHAPAGEVERIAAVMRSSINMASPIMATIASDWVRNGIADRLSAGKRALAAERQALAKILLGDAGTGATLHTHPASLHCWLTLPSLWRAEEFSAAAHRRGVGVTPAAAFALGPAAAMPEAIRFCLGTAATTKSLEAPLRVLAELLPTVPEPYLSVV